MLQIDRQEGAHLRLVARGRLVASDYDEVVPAIEEQIQAHGPLNALLDIRGLDGLEPGAWVEELRFDVKHRRDFARCAVLGNKPWERVATRLAAPIFKGEVRYFEAGQEEEARRWVEA